MSLKRRNVDGVVNVSAVTTTFALAGAVMVTAWFPVAVQIGDHA